MSNKSELYNEARRCAAAAAKGVSPGHQKLFSSLSRFYESLAKTEAEPSDNPNSRPPGEITPTEKQEPQTRHPD